MSQWNPSDKGSRKWEKRKSKTGSEPRRARKKKVKVRPGVVKGKTTRANQTFPKGFDSSLGYPGEGPAKRGRRSKRREARSRLRVVAKLSKRLLEGVPGKRTISERRLARVGISLREGLLHPTTKKLYQEAFVSMWHWLQRHPPDEILSVRSYDACLAFYIEHAWATGLTRGEAGNALSASITVYPSLRGRGQLSESWYLLNAWSRYEVPLRAPPMPPMVAIAMAWFFVRSGHLGGAFIILAGYDCFLRTGEMLSLTFADVALGANDQGVIKLGHTKTGQRHASFEASALNDPLCGRLFRALVASLPAPVHPDHYIFFPKVGQFYKLFGAGLRWLGIAEFGFKPYSIRRGGATAYFRMTRNMEATLDRGRWASARVARIYVNDGLAREVELHFSDAQHARLRLMMGAFCRWLPA